MIFREHIHLQFDESAIQATYQFKEYGEVLFLSSGAEVLSSRVVGRVLGWISEFKPNGWRGGLIRGSTSRFSEFKLGA